eukprot:gene9754-11390_t
MIEAAKMESIFSSLLASSLLVGLPSIIILCVFLFIYIGILKKKMVSRMVLPPVVANYIMQCLYSITSYWDNIVPQAKIYRLSHDFIVFQCLIVIFALKLIEHLRSNAKTFKELALLTKSNEESLGILLDRLADDGVFVRDDAGRYSVNNMQALIDGDDVDCILSLFQHPSIAKAWVSLKESVEAGVTGFPGMPSGAGGATSSTTFFDFMDEKDTYLKNIFDAAMRQKADMIRQHFQIASSFNFSRFKDICDIGGGFGFLGFQILRNHASTSVVVLELDETIKHGMEIASNDPHKRSMLDCGRFVYRVGDMFQPRSIPKASAYLLTEVLNLWSNQDSIRILQSISSVMRKEKTTSGRSPSLLIINEVVEETHGGHEDYWRRTSVGELMMAAIVGSIRRSRHDWEELFHESGLNLVAIKRIYSPSYLSLLELTV